MPCPHHKPGECSPTCTMADPNGISLRDYFAGMALQGLLANPNEIPADEVVRGAYRYADAMLKARKEGGK